MVSVMLMCGTGSGVEKPIGEAVLQIDMLLGKERKVNVRGKTPELKITETIRCSTFTVNLSLKPFFLALFSHPISL